MKKPPQPRKDHLKKQDNSWGSHRTWECFVFPPGRVENVMCTASDRELRRAITAFALGLQTALVPANKAQKTASKESNYIQVFFFKTVFKYFNCRKRLKNI